MYKVGSNSAYVGSKAGENFSVFIVNLQSLKQQISFSAYSFKLLIASLDAEGLFQRSRRAKWVS